MVTVKNLHTPSIAQKSRKETPRISGYPYHYPQYLITLKNYFKNNTNMKRIKAV
jgi:hypothetical protein